MSLLDSPVLENYFYSLAYFYSYGFDDPFDYCCGGEKQNPDTVFCEEANNKTHEFGGSCQNPFKFVSRDSIHYTQAANT
ncbi:GDSL esterase/lipase [Melia azedarach]|uniref:GDSL esterase/lipase n=1 Tax=Melia azedarach TaxID=155640 RepID=A0ACC1YFB4_MELAZ|nr:GDSL esterase/lipase [Melia azedarach]